MLVMDPKKCNSSPKNRSHRKKKKMQIIDKKYKSSSKKYNILPKRKSQRLKKEVIE